MRHNIHILVTITKPEQFIPSTLTLDTLRVGFPSASVTVYSNGNDHTDSLRIRDMVKKMDASYRPVDKRIRHGKWIQEVVEREDGHVIIVDPDIIFFEDCEGFTYEAMLSGRFCPIMFNEFAGCVSYERIHTSFMMIKSCEYLREIVRKSYPPAVSSTGAYSPLNPYLPVVTCYRGQLQFYDTCSILYNMVGGYHFGADRLKRYAHINSASFYDVMLERTEDKPAFIEQHEQARNRDYDWFREWYKAEDDYYVRMHAKAIEMISTRPQQSPKQSNDQTNDNTPTAS